MAKPVEHLTVGERVASGKAPRAVVPWTCHATWNPVQWTLQPLERFLTKSDASSAGRIQAEMLAQGV